ncbi:MAG: DNA-binding MarR family transcriptional regulator [Sulfurimonas sp.]|jgi:DNA-binding MarR family transcriptional regulator
MKKDEFEKDIKLIKDKTPKVYNDIVRITSPFYRVYTELNTISMQFLQNHHDISPSELDILTSLLYSGGDEYTLSPTSLMQRIIFSSGGMTKILKKMQSKGLIKRLDNIEDGRSKLVQLTQEGKQTTQIALEKLLLLEADYFSSLNANEKEELSRLLLECMKK